MIILSITLLVTGALLTALFLIVRSLTADVPLPLDAQWIDELSVERYRPMLNLLDDRDLLFLRTQPGFTPRMAANFRIQRCNIFRGYLRSLEADFRRVCAAIKILMLHSADDRPDLASVLVRSQAVFTLGMIGVEARLFLYRWGLGGVDAEVLVRTFEAMRIELKSLTPAHAGAAA